MPSEQIRVLRAKLHESCGLVLWRGPTRHPNRTTVRFGQRVSTVATVVLGPIRDGTALVFVGGRSRGVNGML